MAREDQTTTWRKGAFDTLSVLSNIKNPNTLNYFTYSRFKVRIARSSALNFFLIGLMLSWIGYYIVGFAFVLFSALALWLWYTTAGRMYAAIGKEMRSMG